MFISPIGLMADYRIRAAKWGLQDLSIILLIYFLGALNILKSLIKMLLIYVKRRAFM
jgi:hypothetical protein